MTPLKGSTMQERLSERGEGKVGCVLTLAVLLALGAIAAKVVPVYYANNSLEDTAVDLASKAGILAPASLELQLQAKARDLEIPEALAKGAMEIRSVGENHTGTCTIHLKYSRKVDLYGAYQLAIDTDKTVMKPYMDVR